MIKRASRDFDGKLQEEMEGRRLEEKGVGKLKKYDFRLPEKETELLRKHLAEDGVSLSAGVRQAILQYMRRCGIL